MIWLVYFHRYDTRPLVWPVASVIMPHLSGLDSPVYFLTMYQNPAHAQNSRAKSLPAHTIPVRVQDPYLHLHSLRVTTILACHLYFEELAHVLVYTCVLAFMRICGSVCALHVAR